MVLWPGARQDRRHALSRALWGLAALLSLAILLAEKAPVEELITQYPEHGPAISPKLMAPKLPIIVWSDLARGPKPKAAPKRVPATGGRLRPRAGRMSRNGGTARRRNVRL